MLQTLASAHRLPSHVEFVLCVGDHPLTIIEKKYRGPSFRESRPIFTIPSCTYSHDIPFPVVPDDRARQGGYEGSWNDAIEDYVEGSNDVSWKNKIEKAVFRGAFRPSTYYSQRHYAYKNWKVAGRGRLAFIGEAENGFLNVNVGGSYDGKYHELKRLGPRGFHQFKYIVYAEGNSFWSNRLLFQLFGPSAVVKQETPCGQWFEPLLNPLVHYIPTDLRFENLVDQVKWARKQDHQVEEIVSAANKFASDYLTSEGMQLYVSLLLKSYAKLIFDKKPIKKRRGARSFEELFGKQEGRR